MSLAVFEEKAQWEKAQIIAYEQIRQIEEDEKLAKVFGGK